MRRQKRRQAANKIPPLQRQTFDRRSARPRFAGHAPTPQTRWRHHRRHPERPKVRCQVIQNNSGYFLILSLPTSTKQMNEQKPGNKQPFNKPQISVRPMQPPKTNPPDCSQESARKCTPKSLQIQPINPSQTRKSQFNPKKAPQKPKIQHSNPSPKAPKTTPKITRLFPQSKNHPANIKALLGKPHPTSPNPKPELASLRLNCSIGVTARPRFAGHAPTPPSRQCRHIPLSNSLQDL